MARCETCGNNYEKSFEVVMGGRTHTFDCFECAIQMLAPACSHCGCAIIGHGLETDGEIYCCEHCVRHKGEAVGHDAGDGAKGMSEPRVVPAILK